MIHIGQHQTLRYTREEPQGLTFESENGDEVLMPRRFARKEWQSGDQIEVFVYHDARGSMIATTERPLITLGQFAYLLVTDVNEIGAFCEWGLSRELLIPFRNQAARLQPGQRCLVHLYLDNISGRLVGTTKVRQFLAYEADENLQMGQQVDLLVYARTELGYKVIIDQHYSGLVYISELFKPLFLEQQLTGYIKPIRGDGKIDVSLFPIGHRNIDIHAQKILEKLQQHEGFLPFTDKSDPDLIRAEFGISKKLFKKSIGMLYKQKLVLLKEDGVYQT